jgi:SAM-dependent methyltransferase
MSSEEYVVVPKAVYDMASEQYVKFAGTEISAATECVLDQTLLVAFIELVKQGTVLRVADLGCGPGRVAAFMAGRGLDVVGVDLSPAMITIARETHPHIAFVEGRLDALPIGTGELAGAVYWYSIIYTPPEHLTEAFAELARVVRPGGHALVAFQAGVGEAVQRDRAHGTDLSLTLYRHDVGSVSRYLEDAGLKVSATVRREPELEHESGAQAFVIARRAKEPTAR